MMYGNPPTLSRSYTWWCPEMTASAPHAWNGQRIHSASGLVVEENGGWWLMTIFQVAVDAANAPWSHWPCTEVGVVPSGSRSSESVAKNSTLPKRTLKYRSPPGVAGLLKYCTNGSAPSGWSQSWLPMAAHSRFPVVDPAPCTPG